MSERQTFYIRESDCRDMGLYFEIDGQTYKGNLFVERMSKPLHVQGYQHVKGNQHVQGDQHVQGYQIVESSQLVDGGKCLHGLCRWPVKYTKNKITIGCKTMTASEWEAWFRGGEVFQTPRDSFAFRQIHKAFQIAKTAQEFDEGVAG